MKIAVGSTNPVKVGAVRLVAGQIWPEAEVAGLSVPSGVRAMPLSDEESIAGARNRAYAARQEAGATLGVGIEGGVRESAVGLLLTAWAVAVDGQGEEGVGSSGCILLPAFIARRIRQGEELGPLMDQVLGVAGVKHKEGTVGALTAGIIPRQQALALGVAYALAPFIMPALYGQAAGERP